MRPEVALPIFIALTSGALSLAAWRSSWVQRWVGVLGTAALLASSIWLLISVIEEGHVVMHMGGWQAPIGITLVADLFSALMVVLTGLMGFVVAIYSLATTSKTYEKFGYFPLMHLLLAGVAGAFLTGDIFNLYVWFEVLLVASFALLILGGERSQMEGAIKYVTLNLLSSAIFLTAIGLLYGMVGTLNMADIAVKLREVEHTGMLDVIAVMFMVAFGIKAGAFPLFFWLPASYHTPPVAVSALFAGLLTKVGVYALYRFFTLIFGHDPDFTHNLLLWGAGLTMLTGVLGAAAQFEFRRILSFHSISQIGYMMLALALFTPLALVGGLFYIFHHSLVKSNLFLISGMVHRLKGTYDLKKLGGLYKERPLLAILFLIAALSLAGLPPLSGFFAKLIVIKSGVGAQAWLVTFVALLVGLLTLYSMIKIWAEVFWKKAPDPSEGEPPRLIQTSSEGQVFMYISIGILALGAVLMGVAAQPVFEIAEAAANQLLNPDLYIEAVLGGKQ